MAFVGSSCGCRAALSFPSPVRFRFPLVRTSSVLSLGLSNLSPSSSSSSIIKTGCAQSRPLLLFLRRLTEKRQKQRPRRSGEDMLLFQHPRARKRATFLVLMTMMVAWGFMIITSKFTSQSTAKAIKSTEMEGSTSTVPSIVVYVTVPNKEAGKKLAESIVGEKLAACVNRVPGIESVYFWDGKIQTDSEELLIIKTRESLLEALTEHVKANHEYDLPEVISMPITGGNVKYLEWIKNSTKE